MKHVPKHRSSTTSVFGAPARTARRVVLFSGVAVAATGVAVSGGVLGANVGPTAVADGPGSTQAAAAQLSAVTLDEAAEKVLASADLAGRATVVSRSDQRKAADPLKRAALSDEVGRAVTASESLSESAPRDIGRALMADYGFSSDQFGCLDSLWTRESNWTVNADNPTSSAYGIPQSLPGSKMASAGADWATNPVTQIKWGLGYIQDVYGSPCGAWAASQAKGWY